MSTVHNTMQAVEQAVKDYNFMGASNTVQNLKDITDDIQPYCMMTRTYYLEFNAAKPRARLPECLVKDVGSLIGDNVFLQDPEGNRIQVAVEKKNCKIYFTHGWPRLRDFYGIGLGAWLVLLYINPFLFRIKIRKIDGLEVAYPKKDPPHQLMLLQHHRRVSSNGPIPYFVAPRIFSHVLEKTLTSSDVESGILELSWNGFCQHALPSNETELTLIDWCGYTWKCHLGFGDHPHKICKIYGQWRNICKARSFVEGVNLKFGVTEDSNNNILHFRISPFIGVRTTLIAPKKTGGYKAFYQTEQYFML